MSKKFLRQFMVVNLAGLLSFSSVVPAAAGGIEDLLHKEDEESSLLTVEPQIFNQANEEELTVTYEGDEENLTLYLFDADKEELLGKFPDVSLNSENSQLYKWDFTLENGGESDVISLEDGIYYITLAEEPFDGEEDFAQAALDQAVFVQNSEQPSLELSFPGEEENVLEENILEGKVISLFTEDYYNAFHVGLSYTLEQEGDVYENGELSHESDGSFLLEDKLQEGSTLASFHLLDPAGNEHEESVEIELVKAEASIKEEDSGSNVSNEAADSEKEASEEDSESNETSEEDSHEEEALTEEEESDKDSEKDSEETKKNQDAKEEDTDLDSDKSNEEDALAEEEESDKDSVKDSEENKKDQDIKEKDSDLEGDKSNEEDALAEEEESDKDSDNEKSKEEQKEDPSENSTLEEEEKDQKKNDEDVQLFSTSTADTLTNEETVEMKNNLSLLGFGNFPSDPSTTYGPVTMGVVEEFQAAYSLPITGIADDETLNLIDHLLETTFYNGAEGPYVRDLKMDLTNLGFGNFPSYPSERYGPVTMGVVEDFQRAYNLSVTGIADADTLAAIDGALQTAYYDGAEGPHVRDLKMDLTNLGFGNFPSHPSERYGPVTMGVVEDYQRAYNLSVTGIADADTLAAIDGALQTAYYDGAEGPHVRDLKMDLTNLGFGNFPSYPSERYGPVTMGVVEDFQRAYNLNVTGIADTNTLAAIDEALKTAFYDGAEGPHVRDLKMDLTNLGFGNFPSYPSERYGPVTMGVVEDFQGAYNLSVTGIADANTLAAIEEALQTAFYDGAEGPHVRDLKMDLTNLGFGNFPSYPSERYGPVTMGVVEDFQRAYNLSVTGIADADTLAAIDQALTTVFYDGAEGPHIRELKLDLTKLGFGNFPSDPSERFGPVTMGVVEDFQNYYGLSVTGIPDERTLDYMDSLFNSPYSNGQNGDYVRELKQDLTRLGYGNFPSSPSTAYGSVTAGVVSEFQERNGLVVNGIGDGPTLEMISQLIEETAQQGRVTATSLNVRSGPSTSYGTVGSLSNGSIVSLISQESNGWYKIAFNGGHAYVSGLFIEEIYIDEDFDGSSIIGYVNGSSLNVRSDPGTSNGVIDSLSRDDRVEIISTYSRSGQNSWHQIRYDGGKTGYVSAGYIQLATKQPSSTGPLVGKTIILDAGHGAQDAGGIGGGMHEKDVVLDISVRAEKLLREAGAEVIMIRRTDFFLSLSQRSFIANRSGADVFVSVHTNMFNGTARGTETFWHGKYERANSIKLAHAIQDATVAKMGTHYRRVAEGNYHVVRETQIPSALLEIGFKDYPDDAAKLRSDAYRDRAAEGIRDGLINYFR
ncbi:peptidoglycan-binding protein [Salipaludibacillus aurantiacus]|uniref:N-acetylmuramoyl-L-alanine amidase n=1 Tax=Salipaludibacillus aurantiacus TaxID=1601833 RepID=A0A1H9VEL8_9BACI|nr:peptidoglycan-binding protein [Salipaludibacillus aurantiacus]SES20216.1 N-acetylmuramoyl-L-alanine amidase [Salipaludibacillus aurantiacus]